MVSLRTCGLLVVLLAITAYNVNLSVNNAILVGRISDGPEISKDQTTVSYTLETSEVKTDDEGEKDFLFAYYFAGAGSLFILGSDGTHITTGKHIKLIQCHTIVSHEEKMNNYIIENFKKE